MQQSIYLKLLKGSYSDLTAAERITLLDILYDNKKSNTKHYSEIESTIKVLTIESLNPSWIENKIISTFSPYTDSVNVSHTTLKFLVDSPAGVMFSTHQHAYLEALCNESYVSFSIHRFALLVKENTYKDLLGKQLILDLSDFTLLLQ